MTNYKSKRDNITNWKNKRRESFEHKKGTKFYKFFGNNYQVYQGSNFKSNKQQNPNEMKEREVLMDCNNNTTQREPLK